jgi:glycosyltransferase involved in cell wall biosynthesis
VVIPARNEEGRIAGCLEALRDQSLRREEYEVVVVDDGSEDNTAEAAARLGARVIRQEKKGAAAARNQGVVSARGEIVLFTDADCRPERNWAERLSTPLKRPSVQGTVGRLVSRQSHWVARLIQLELDERYSKMGHHERIDFLNSGNCGFKRTLLCQNRYDESFHWLEDVELSFRLAENGNRMIFVTDALVDHPHPESLLAYMRRKFRYASFAPYVYRRHPNKTFSDTRTPLNRRLQLVLLTLALASVPAALLFTAGGVFSLICLAASIACSVPVCRRAARESPALGTFAPVFVLMGNAAFVLGSLWGVAVSAVRKPGHSSPIADHVPANESSRNYEYRQ